MHGRKKEQQNIKNSDGRRTLESKRNRSIDAFRGLAIVGMIFFSLLLRLGKDLPETIRHNVPGAFHIGDVVLPMFLFASGMSLAYFFARAEGLPGERFYQKIFTRLGLLAMVGIGLSYFSAGGFFRMDEVLLSAILFLGCVILFRMKWFVNLGIIVAIYCSFPVVAALGWDASFSNYYLGGYLAAVYYLPVMLTGLLLGQGILSGGFFIRRNLILLGILAALLPVSLVMFPPDKLGVTPSFMILSILICTLLYAIVIAAVKLTGRIAPLEYLGRTPLRYWVLMYALVLIPLQLNSKLGLIQVAIKVPWPMAVVFSLVFLLALAGGSYVFEKVRMGGEPKGEKISDPTA